MSPAEPVCAECGASLAPGQERCWLCQSRLQSQAPVNPYAAPVEVTEPRAAQFSLASLFLLTTLVAVCLGVFLLAPGLGVLLAVVAVPALARTVIAGQRRRQAGQQPTTSQKVWTFIWSCALIYAVGQAGMIAFFCVCLGAGLAGMAAGANDNWVIVAAVGLGALVAIPLTVWLLWVSRPR